jgi:RNA-directed DNA polymerase
MSGSSWVNIDELALELYRAERRVLKIQHKLHRWAGDDPHHRVDDLYNLVTDPSRPIPAGLCRRGNARSLKRVAKSATRNRH